MRNLLWVTTVWLCACTGPTDTDTDTDTDVELPETYSFPSRFDDDSSVSYNGQVFRQLLIDDMSDQIAGMTERINEGWFPAEGDVKDEILFYYAFDSSTSGAASLNKTTTPSTLQITYDDVSSGKDLWGKLAGNDAKGQHKDWSVAFQGWQGEGGESPELLVRSLIDTLDAQAVQYANGTLPLGPLGTPVEHVYLTPEGQDIKQLLQKFTRMAVAFSQGADDYLDDDTPDKGLMASHSVAEEGKNYSALEHAWDEGFGYFGASKAYGTWTDDEIADGYIDEDGDGAIDLGTEYCWGHSKNAAKRDRGAVVATDFTAETWNGFLAGRHLLAQTTDELNEEEMTALKGHRDQALAAWEHAIVATVIHYINDVLQDMQTFGTDSYSFSSHAKHWSELKGFALGLQFNRFSPLTDEEFVLFHETIGDAPVLPNASETDISSYAESLRSARTLLGDAYDFPVENLGDDNGENGW